MTDDAPSRPEIMFRMILESTCLNIGWGRILLAQCGYFCLRARQHYIDSFVNIRRMIHCLSYMRRDMYMIQTVSSLLKEAYLLT